MSAVLAVVLAVVLAAGCLVLLPFSMRPAIVTGPPWRGALVVAGLLVPLVGVALLALAAGPLEGLLLGVVVAAMLVAAAAGGSPMATGVLRLADPAAARANEGVALERAGSGSALRPGAPAGASPLPVVATLSAPGLLRGGATLGLLERVATFGTLAVGSPEGIAVVLAVKGLGRFGELKVPAAPERFMIGTFASVLWACACWAVVVAALA
ncbi:hypothetical protein [Aquipuribacter nitratireducens]|uniref:Uncharacterized protein n=1 Tax=Aquipuribacter nitratireducens TaxID=650104 RepID=A0ABW0GP55_9MICO